MEGYVTIVNVLTEKDTRRVDSVYCDCGTTVKINNSFATECYCCGREYDVFGREIKFRG